MTFGRKPWTAASLRAPIALATTIAAVAVAPDAAHAVTRHDCGQQKISAAAGAAVVHVQTVNVGCAAARRVIRAAIFGQGGQLPGGWACAKPSDQAGACHLDARRIEWTATETAGTTTKQCADFTRRGASKITVAGISCTEARPMIDAVIQQAPRDRKARFKAGTYSFRWRYNGHGPYSCKARARARSARFSCSLAAGYTFAFTSSR